VHGGIEMTLKKYRKTDELLDQLEAHEATIFKGLDAAMVSCNCDCNQLPPTYIDGVRTQYYLAIEKVAKFCSKYPAKCKEAWPPEED